MAAVIELQDPCQRSTHQIGLHIRCHLLGNERRGVHERPARILVFRLGQLALPQDDVGLGDDLATARLVWIYRPLVNRRAAVTRDPILMVHNRFRLAVRGLFGPVHRCAIETME